MRCDICGGKRLKKLVSYNIFFESRLVVVENVPAEVCGQCGGQYFDPNTVEMLQKTVRSKKRPKRIIETHVYDLSLT